MGETTRTIGKVLVANRGEIARRIMRTCRRMGIETVAVYSEADAAMPFVDDADEAFLIGPPPSAQSYLNIDAILNAAEAAGADAVHPGYGFLAENAEFAARCAQAGLIFIGPSADAITAMGSKQSAKALAKEAGVPVVPGYDGADQAALEAEAKKVGFPILLKASAGGGGKGMKLVSEEAELTDAIASARRESESAFGDGTLLVEKYIERPRHIEIQILVDHHGHALHLFERECSIQRRHQKVIEEAPSVALDDATRASMGEAAIKIANAIGYTNAGTVEFIVDATGAFYFLEVNTRLQVEHPVTECITGLDLVEQQILIAQGQSLAMSQAQLQIDGAAIEARLYAEDPDNRFLPKTGTVVQWAEPTLRGVRFDSGVQAGSEVGIHYDPMLAKVIAHGPDRTTAIRRLIAALKQLRVSGLVTNRDFLVSVLAHPAFAEGALHTHFIEEHAESLKGEHTIEARDRALIVATLFDHEQRKVGRALDIPSGWRNNFHTEQSVDYKVGADEVPVSYRALRDGRFHIHVGDCTKEAKLVVLDGGALTVQIDDHRFTGHCVREGNLRHVHALGRSIVAEVLPRFPDSSGSQVPGGCVAPMPGKIIDVRVAEGAGVVAGDVLIVMEAMKMEHAVKAPHTGVVQSLAVEQGEQVEADALLAVVSRGED